jgi:hypothetical protein
MAKITLVVEMVKRMAEAQESGEKKRVAGGKK